MRTRHSKHCGICLGLWSNRWNCPKKIWTVELPNFEVILYPVVLNKRYYIQYEKSQQLLSIRKRSRLLAAMSWSTGLLYSQLYSFGESVGKENAHLNVRDFLVWIRSLIRVSMIYHHGVVQNLKIVIGKYWLTSSVEASWMICHVYQGELVNQLFVDHQVWCRHCEIVHSIMLRSSKGGI